MIRFCCEHCGKTVCVGVAHVGAKGRCPKCGKIVTIPSPPKPSINNNVAALAAALHGDNGDSGMSCPPPPPPPKAHGVDTDEFDLVDIHASEAFETDTYPAIRDDDDDDDGNDDDSDSGQHKEESTVSPRDGKSRLCLILILVAILGAAILMALLYLLR